MSELRSVASDDLLVDLKVVELSSSVAGAYCGKVLAQLGADVLRYGPATILTASSKAEAAGRAFLHQEKQVHGSDFETLPAALATADIVIVDADGDEGEMLDWTLRLALRDVPLKSGAQVLTISASGQGEAGTGATSCAWAAMSWAIGARDRAPLMLPYDIADYELGISAAAGVLAGLLRPATDPARSVDVIGREVLAYFVGQLVPNYLPFGRPWRREGRRPSMSGGVYPCGLFPCRDGMVAIYCRSDREWQGVLEAMGRPAWSREERFQDPKLVARAFADEADAHLFPWLEKYSRADLTAMGTQFDFPVAPVRPSEEVLRDQQFAFRRSLVPATRDPNMMVPAAPWRLLEVGANSTTAARPIGSGSSPSRLLEGVRVLDFSWVWSGPMVTSILTDLGAEVIKIEHPSRPDSLRLRGRPPALSLAPDAPDAEVNPWFNQLNHGKRSAVIDIKSAEGRRQALALAAECDVVVENMRPGALEKLGLGYASLAAANPSIVMLSMSMAGQSGPLRDSKGYAGIMSAMAGLESLVGYSRGGDDPEIVGMTMTALGDPNAAMHSLAVLFAALRRRQREGRGVWIDLAQTDAVLAVMGTPVIEAQMSESAPVYGNDHPQQLPVGHFACRGEDRWLALAIYHDATWRRLARIVGEPLACFVNFDRTQRLEARAQINSALSLWFADQDRDALVERLQQENIPVAPVASYQEMIASDWMRESGLTVAVEHPWLGAQEIFLPPWHYDGQVPSAPRPAPLLGADTQSILDMIARREEHGLRTDG